MADICQLHERNYGDVPSERLEDLKALERKHTPEQLEEAFGKAQDANEGRGAPFGYVESVLAKMGAEIPRQADPKRLLCDECKMPTYLDRMTTRGLFGNLSGVCEDCAKGFPETTVRTIVRTPTARRVEAYWEGVTA